VGDGYFLESKPLPGCISLPKDEYENIASLYVLNSAGAHGPGSTASAFSAGTSSSPFGFSNGGG